MINAKIKHDCKEELNDVSLRATPARMALMQLFESTAKPVDVHTMIAYLEENNIRTDPATVFRIVNMFTEKGLTRQIQLQEGKSRYELAAHPEHHHLVCNNCGDIQDISDCNIEVLESHIEKRKNFKVISHALEFYGLCLNCQK
jgi:Fur family ferric uptake transcriptional regulator